VCVCVCVAEMGFLTLYKLNITHYTRIIYYKRYKTVSIEGYLHDVRDLHP